jgi:hypothetical protein
MKNVTSFPMKSRLLFGISLVLLFAGVYFGIIRKSTTEEELISSNFETVALSEDAPVSFVSQGSEYATSDSDLVKTYIQLYGKFQLKVYSNRQFSIPTDQEIEALRMESNALDQLYTQIPLEERGKVKRVSFPYAKLEVAGKVTYKRFEDLTQKERESLGC